MTSPSSSPIRITEARGRRRWFISGLVVLLVGLLAGGYALFRSGSDTPMTQNASQVMPFDLNATTHTFTKTPGGGVEQVAANDPADAANTDAIRGHLREEAESFQAGDYSDPARIHGADMPGLAELQAGADGLQINYEEIPGGARIVLTSADPSLVSAVHAWFDAQNSDHNMPGMGMGH